jgi:hypothetical protein
MEERSMISRPGIGAAHSGFLEFNICLIEAGKLAAGL